MLKQIRVQNFKAIADCTLDLSPLHLLIGPNDSGKTSFLEAIAAVSRSLDHQAASTFLGRWSGQQLVHAGCGDNAVVFESVIEGNVAGIYKLAYGFPTKDRTVSLLRSSWNNTSILSSGDTLTGHRSRKRSLSHPAFEEANALCEAIAPCWYLRWSARNLSLPATLSPERHLRLAGNGFGLPTMLDDLLGSDRDSFGELERKFCAQFPDVKGLKLKQEAAFNSPFDDPEQTLALQPGNGKQLYFLLVNGAEIPAPQAAEGMLYTLAFMAISYLPDPPKLLLVEEPENGIHPGRMQSIVRLLREMTEKTPSIQIIMTSHSPFLVDEMEPHEVTWCRKENSIITTERLDKNDLVRQQKGLFDLGEIWSNYLDSSTGLPTQ